MSHLEDLIAEYYDWKGFLVKKNGLGRRTEEPVSCNPTVAIIF